MKKDYRQLLRDFDTSIIEERLDYTFKNKELLKLAFIHKSSSDGKSGYENNERLEWLGDRVLGLITAEFLYQNHHSLEEGELTRIFNSIVNGENCGKVTAGLGFDEFLITSKSIPIGSPARQSLLNDVYEAIMGAIYLDSGYEACKELFKRAYEQSKINIEDNLNFKSLVQEWAQKRKLQAPIYKILNKTGPDHAPVFEVSIMINNKTYIANGSSKQIAEQEAAKTFYINEKLNG